MAQVAINADVYAATRQNIFFPGVVPSLDGQCVSLVKWFMAEMSSVPNPQAARGDARYVGKTLVAQGHAVEVPYSQRRRGDIICYEYGTYGHIAVQLSGGRVFEQNVNMGGVQSKIVDGARVYASRIGSEAEAWRHDAHVYRLKSYNEKGDNVSTIATKDMVDSLAHAYLDDSLATNPGLSYYVGQPVENVITAFNGSEQRAKYLKHLEGVLWIANVRGERLDKIAALVGAKNGDDYETIKNKINELKANPGDGSTYVPVGEPVFTKKPKS